MIHASDRIRKELNNCLTYTDFVTDRHYYRGKVRDCYANGETRLLIASDRISAFDHVFDQAIPFKGQVLNQIAAWSLRQTEDIISNHVIEVLDPNVTLAKECQPIPLEIVVRGYLTGHAWREYKSGSRNLCDNILPEGMKEHQKFDLPIITPSTKASVGHDEDISIDQAIEEEIISEDLAEEITEVALMLYKRGSEIAYKQGLILVDTKYEFGLYEGELYLMDEIHTPDSSRYFYLDGYQERFDLGEPQKQLSKEFVREWLMERNFQGLEGQKKPDLTDEFRVEISQRYIELFEKLTGQSFVFPEEGNILQRIEKNISEYL